MTEAVKTVGHPLPPTVPGGVRILRQFRKDPIHMFTTAFREYGDVVNVIHVGSNYVVLASHPQDIKRIMLDNHKNYNKQTRGFGRMRLVLGNGLLTSEGSFWLRQRRIAQPAFGRKRIGGFAETMVQATKEMVESWQPMVRSGEAVDISEEMMQVTLRIIGETMLSKDVSSDAGAVSGALEVLLAQMRKRMFGAMLPLWLPTKMNRDFHKAKRTLDDIVEGTIAERRASGEDKGDLLSMLMQATDEETGEQMDNLQLRDEIMTIFLAGHETTANALTWTFYLLSRHPGIARRVEAELEDVLNGRLPTLDDLPQLAYTEQVLKESMRLFPPAWIVARLAVEADVLSGFQIPAGTYTLFSPYITHRHPAFWDNPEGFDPDRFAPELEKERPRFAYFPFGGGPRICIGNHFAMMEGVLILATVLQQIRPSLCPGFTPHPEPMVTLRPKNGMHMTLHKTT